jgi:ribosome-associated translation inhibitor RaiA
MQLRIRARHLEPPPETLRAVERRIRLALGRHASGIERTWIALSPGREGTRCRIRARLREGEQLLSEDEAADLLDAAATAARRLALRLERRRALRSDIAGTRSSATG